MPAVSPNVAIFIKSYPRDFGWLAYCLRSIHKFVTGYSEIVVALPSRHGLNLMKERIVIADPWFDAARPGAPSAGYYHQMYVKLCADLICPTADFILIVDSDCVFLRPFDVGEMFRDGKPMLLRRTWEEAGDGITWREPAERALGVPVTHDTMASHPFIYRRDTFTKLRKWIEGVHGMPLLHYIREQDRFIEFVTLGNYVIQQQPDLYAIIDQGENDSYPRPLLQSWSWGGLDNATREKLETILA